MCHSCPFVQDRRGRRSLRVWWYNGVLRFILKRAKSVDNPLVQQSPDRQTIETAQSVSRKTKNLLYSRRFLRGSGNFLPKKFPENRLLFQEGFWKVRKTFCLKSFLSFFGGTSFEKFPQTPSRTWRKGYWQTISRYNPSATKNKTFFSKKVFERFGKLFA